LARWCCPNSRALSTPTFGLMIEDVQTWLKEKQDALLPSGSLRARFVRGAFWALTGTVIAQVLQLAATIIVARWLGRAEYGEIGIVRSTVGMFGVFVGLGLGLTATKYVAELREQDPARAGRIASLTMTVALVSGVLVTAALILLAPWLAIHTLASPAVSGPLAIGAGLLLLGEVNGVQIGILSGLEAFGALARVSLWAGLWSFPIIVGGTLIWGLDGAISGLVASAAVSCALTHFTLRKELQKVGVPFSRFGSWQEHQVLWKFSLPAFLSVAVMTPATWACNAMLVNRPKGYAEMGLFSAADQWRNVVLFLPGIISRVVLPILSGHSSESAKATTRFSNTLEASFSLGILMAFPLVAFLSFGSSLIVRTYGADFAGMRYPLLGLLYAGGVMVVAAPLGLAVQAKGAMWSVFVNNLAWALVLLGSFHFLLLGRGAWGLGLAYAGSYVFLSVTFVWYFCRAGYFPWGLGARTSLACLTLLLFSFSPVYLSAHVALDLSPAATIMALVATWVFLPPSARARLLQASAWVSRQGQPFERN
jgi:O-antigen/teichoic acid export membrane protein